MAKAISYSVRLDQLLDADATRDVLQQLYDIEFEIIEASRHGLPGRKLDTETYIDHKIKLGDLASDLARASEQVEMCEMIWHAMPTPKRKRSRARLVTDGYVRTGRYKMIDGVRIPVLEKIR